MNKKNTKTNIATGQLIKELRKNKFYTQEEFAKKLKKSQTWLFKIETGANGLSMDMLYKVCEILDMPSYNFIKNIQMKKGRLP